jgi:hypothetical protein
MSGDGDGMDSTLEYILSDACGFLLLCPFMPRPRAGNVYPLRGAPGHVWPGAQVSASGRRERREGQTDIEIPSTHANRWVEK